MPWVEWRSLWRTSAFRLGMLYGGVFVVAVLILLGLVYWRTAGFMTRQNDALIESELRAFRKLDLPTLKADIAFEIDRDIRHINVYGLFAQNGERLAGNLVSVPRGLAEDGAVQRLQEAALDDRDPASAQMRGAALALPGGELLVVGRDVEPLVEIRRIILRALAWVGTTVLLAGIATTIALSLNPLRRIRAIRAASLRVMRGDVRARLPLTSRHDELDMLARIVNDMLEEIERLLSEVKSVCDAVAHDLRTPLTRLRAAIYRLQEDLSGQPAHRAAAERAVAETDALLARFQALLRISEIEDRQRRSGFGEVDLDAIVAQTVELYEPMAEDHGVELIYAPRRSLRIDGDGELLFEALNNLVDNAIKFSPHGGRVRVGVERDAQGPRVDVLDEGPGIADAERDTVMQRFYRSEAVRDTPGSGLGLSIVSAIARLHRFDLEIAREANGTRATLHCSPRGLDA